MPSSRYIFQGVHLTRKSLSILVLLIVTACGGGGGAVSPPAPAPPPPPEMVQLTAENADVAARQGILAVEILVQIAAAAANNIIDVADIGELSADLRCSEGSASFLLVDNDTSRSLNQGDQLTISFTDCVQPSYPFPITGTVVADIGPFLPGVDHSIIGSANITMQTPLQIIESTIRTVYVSGTLRVGFNNSKNDRALFVDSVGVLPLKIRTVDTTSDLTDTITDAYIKRLGNASSDYSLTVSISNDSESVGGLYNCVTSVDFEGQLPHLPISGALTCTGNQKSAIKAVADSNLEISLSADPDGDGSFEFASGGGNWNNYSNGQLVTAIVNRPNVDRTKEIPEVRAGFLGVATNDIVYSSASDMLYVTTDTGISEIDPKTWTVTRSVRMSDPPRTMAVSDDGGTIWVSFKFLRELRSIDVTTMTEQQSIYVATPLANETARPWDIEFAPGRNDLIVVAMYTEQRTVMFQDGIPLPNEISRTVHGFGPTDILFIDDSTMMASNSDYTTANDLASITFDANGLILGKKLPDFGGNDLFIGNNYIFSQGGIPVDYVNETIIGRTFYVPGLSTSDDSGAHLDNERDLIYLNGVSDNGDKLMVFSQSKLTPVGEYYMPIKYPNDYVGSPFDLRRIVETNDGYLVLGFDGAINYSDKWNLTQTPKFNQECTPSDLGGQFGPATLIELECFFFGPAIYDPIRDLVYASRPSPAGRDGNSIAVIDPQTGIIQEHIFVGSEPGRLSLSASGNTLYVSLTRATRVALIDLQAKSVDAFLDVVDVPVSPTNRPNPIYPRYVAASPINEDEAVVSSTRSMQLFRGGVAIGSPMNTSEDPVGYSSDGTRVFQVDGTNIDVYSADTGGLVYAGSTVNGGVFGVGEINDDLVFDQLGQVFDPFTGELVGSCPIFPPDDPPSSAIVYVTSDSGLAYYWVRKDGNYLQICDYKQGVVGDPYPVPDTGTPVFHVGVNTSSSIAKAGSNRLILTTGNKITILDPSEIDHP